MLKPPHITSRQPHILVQEVQRDVGAYASRFEVIKD